MSEKTVLVIDDSATIRRLVDSELGGEGYRVIMAPDAESGLQMSADERPDLILLDHQLPGTTGYEVCCQLIADPELKQIPVVVSSTLRKKAYVEYTECSNVIDMLPKPYTPDLLRTTIANALDTAAMIVQSQSDGTAVPEVIDALADGDLAGSFSCFSFREVIDFLNNANKCGLLEIDLGRQRVTIYLAKGRIQAVTASGIEPELISNCLPSAISDLAPMVNFTVRGRNCSEVDGLVELLDNKVLDARLLRQLLRHQAAVLINYCCQQEIKTFRFESGRTASSLFSKLPLDISFLALNVEASLIGTQEISESEMEQTMFVRTARRGHNLDRAGLSAQHMKLLNQINNPVNAEELADRNNLDRVEVYRVLRGFKMSDLVSEQTLSSCNTVIAVTSEPGRAHRLTEFFKSNNHSINGRAVRDLLAVKLLLRRVRPDFLLFDTSCQRSMQTMEQLRSEDHPQLKQAKWFGICTDQHPVNEALQDSFDALVKWPDEDQELNGLFEMGSEPSEMQINDCVEQVC